jgi:phospholipid/cholesterol/gamma-HCH transport system substrate-binding protein
MTETRHPVRRQIVGLVVLVLVIGLSAGVLIGVIGPDMFSGNGRVVKAVFANTQQLEKGDEVRVKGVEVGTVTAIKLDPGGRSATVSMQVNAQAVPLYKNASAVLQWKTLLGSAFYVSLTRGSSTAGVLGNNEISVHHTADQVELDDVLAVDNGGAKQGMKTLFPQLATGLSDSQAVSSDLTTLGDAAPTIAKGVGALRGEDATKDYDLEGLVSHTATVLKALNAPDDELEGLVQGAAGTLAVTAQRADDLETALDEATPSQEQTQTTFKQLNTTLKLAKPLLDKLGTAAPSVAPTFKDVRPTLTGANTLLHRADPLLKSLPSGAASLASASKVGLPLIKSLTPDLYSVADDILPYLNAQDPATQHSTAEMIGPTFEALGPDIAGQMDQNGHFIRFPATVGSSPLYINCQEYLSNPSATQLLSCESVQQSLNELLGTNPLASVEGTTTTATTTSTTPTTTTASSGGATPLRSTPPAGTVTSASGATSPVSSTTNSLGASVSSVLSKVGGSLSSALGSK